MRAIEIGDRAQSVHGARGKVVALATIRDGEMVVRGEYDDSRHSIDRTQRDGDFVRVHWDHADYPESSFTALELARFDA